MRILKAKKLKKRDVIGIISPASFPADSSRIQNGVTYFEKLGYRVEIGKNVGKELGYLAGSDEQRAEDLNDMFRNKQVKAIFCLRGGYGSGRLLDKIDFGAVRRNPKIFVGYSDITSLQMAFLQKAGLVTFAGPMVAVDFYQEEVDEFTEEFFWKIVTSSRKIGKIINPNGEPFYSLTKSRGEGRLIGGNLAVFSSLFGTPYFPNLKHTILLLEDISEPPYRIDRMLNQLKLSGILNKTNGIVLGRFVDCYEADATKKTLTLNEVIENYFSALKKPVLYNIKHGHIQSNITIPFGLNAKVNASRKIFEITESAVS
jgi:muramoyltetrapeptide carboxypeptidase